MDLASSGAGRPNPQAPRRNPPSQSVSPPSSQRPQQQQTLSFGVASLALPTTSAPTLSASHSATAAAAASLRNIALPAATDKSPGSASLLSYSNSRAAAAANASRTAAALANAAYFNSAQTAALRLNAAAAYRAQQHSTTASLLGPAGGHSSVRLPMPSAQYNTAPLFQPFNPLPMPLKSVSAGSSASSTLSSVTPPALTPTKHISCTSSSQPMMQPQPSTTPGPSPRPSILRKRPGEHSVTSSPIHGSSSARRQAYCEQPDSPVSIGNGSVIAMVQQQQPRVSSANTGSQSPVESDGASNHSSVSTTSTMSEMNNNNKQGDASSGGGGQAGSESSSPRKRARKQQFDAVEAEQRALAKQRQEQQQAQAQQPVSAYAAAARRMQAINQNKISAASPKLQSRLQQHNNSSSGGADAKQFMRPPSRSVSNGRATSTEPPKPEAMEHNRRSESPFNQSERSDSRCTSRQSRTTTTGHQGGQSAAAGRNDRDRSMSPMVNIRPPPSDWLRKYDSTTGVTGNGTSGRKGRKGKSKGSHASSKDNKTSPKTENTNNNDEDKKKNDETKVVDDDAKVVDNGNNGQSDVSKEEQEKLENEEDEGPVFRPRPRLLSMYNLDWCPRRNHFKRPELVIVRRGGRGGGGGAGASSTGTGTTGSTSSVCRLANDKHTWSRMRTWKVDRLWAQLASVKCDEADNEADARAFLDTCVPSASSRHHSQPPCTSVDSSADEECAQSEPELVVEDAEQLEHVREMTLSMMQRSKAMQHSMQQVYGALQQLCAHGPRVQSRLQKYTSKRASRACNSSSQSLAGCD